ncbi:hypothetical protein EA462_00975 [Natrarchaeobius halalkaliphilus]|uniref:Uncharacterized protein n=1 Tax=Natrarchaeobius halalkaliphilus TaxID=1679091 RepID=A0A3N6MBJ0_9EURY|nr:hypothetical protein [Natrarchaeobius halalkaliphilus]RQG92831.1 hypothetical protein EA462_00975 [Natrarchaeobius halalkaliphilus]
MTERNPTFVRRKFTITKVLDQMLQEMATRHYQGNVSLCLRAAIESHRENLEGEGEFAAHQIKRQLDGLEQRVQKIQMNVDELPIETAKNEKKGIAQSVQWGIKMADGMPAIVEVLDNASSPLRLEDLLEQTELSPPRLQADLSQLVDHGLVVETTDEQQRFGLAGWVNSPGDGETGQ